MSISRGALGGVYNVFNANTYCFLTEKNWDHRVTSHLYEPEYISALKSERLPFLVYIDNSYGIHLKGKTKMLCQNSK